MSDTVLAVVWGACIVVALGALSHWAATQAGYIGADRQPFVPVSTVRTYTAQVGGRQLRCTETIDHAAGSRSLGC